MLLLKAGWCKNPGGKRGMQGYHLLYSSHNNHKIAADDPLFLSSLKSSPTLPGRKISSINIILAGKCLQSPLIDVKHFAAAKLQLTRWQGWEWFNYKELLYHQGIRVSGQNQCCKTASYTTSSCDWYKVCSVPVCDDEDQIWCETQKGNFQGFSPRSPEVIEQFNRAHYTTKQNHTLSLLKLFLPQIDHMF